MAPQVRYKPWLTLFAVFYEKKQREMAQLCAF